MEFSKHSLKYKNIINELSNFKFDGCIELLEFPVRIYYKESIKKTINIDGRNVKLKNGVQIFLTAETKSYTIENNSDIQNILNQAEKSGLIYFKITNDDNSIIHNINDKKMIRYKIPIL